MADEDRRAQFARYFVAHRRWLLAVVGAAIPNAADVEDLCAEVFQVAFEKRADIGDYALGQQRKWLYEAARKAMSRRARDWARYHQALERAFYESPSESSDPLALVIERDERRAHEATDARVRDVAKLLRAEYREVLELNAAGLKGPAIAQRLGITHQLARTRLMQARRQFSQLWIAHYGPSIASGDTP